MLLVLTFSEDATFDELIPHLRGLPFFRFNIDLWRDYRWEITGEGYRFEDKLGRCCEEHAVKAVYLRKLIFIPPYIDVPAGGTEESWQREQLIQMVHGIRDVAAADGKLALVRPAREASKIRQMRLASRWFPVPRWSVFHRSQSSLKGSSAVVKTFAAVPVGQGAHVMVSEVDVERLSDQHSWFIQETLKKASHDVTTVFVNGRLFSYELPRNFEGVDCRLPTTMENLPWSPCEISETEATGIHSMMQTLGLTFGRFDFLRVDGRLWFLEVNPNGQWGWLDPNVTNGLYQAIANEILKVCQRS